MEANYTKYAGSAIKLKLLKTIAVQSVQMCAVECVGKIDCFQFTTEEDESGVRCNLLTKATAGTLMQDFFNMSD